jgi:hypothetical protein
VEERGCLKRDSGGQGALDAVLEYSLRAMSSEWDDRSWVGVGGESRPSCASHRGATRRTPTGLLQVATLDNPALAQIIYFCPHAVEPAVAIDDQDPLPSQEAENRIAEAIVVGSGLVHIETKLRSERS